MPGPHPVVNFAPVITNGQGRGINDTDVPECFISVHDILFPVVHGNDLGVQITPLRSRRFSHLCNKGIHFLILFNRIGDSFCLRQDIGSDILHARHDFCLVPRGLYFSGAAFCQETLGKVIAVHA